MSRLNSHERLEDAAGGGLTKRSREASPSNARKGNAKAERRYDSIKRPKDQVLSKQPNTYAQYGALSAR